MKEIMIMDMANNKHVSVNPAHAGEVMSLIGKALKEHWMAEPVNPRWEGMLMLDGVADFFETDFRRLRCLRQYDANTYVLE